MAIPDASLPSAVPAAKPSSASSSVVRWSVVGVCAVTLAGLGWLATSSSRGDDLPARPAESVPVAAPTAPSSALASTPTPESTSAPAISVDDLPQARNAPPIRSAAFAQPAASASASTFREELAMVEAARSALASGDTDVCLKALDRHDAKFPDGALASEADITRIEAHAKNGQNARARALADRFLTRHPTSPYVERVRSLRAKLAASDEGSR
jgi:Outer membrane lipoprotein